MAWLRTAGVRPASAHVRRRPLGLGAMCVLFACASACAGEAPIAEGEPRLELGTGTSRFEALQDGDEVPMVLGAQGGWHLWIAVRTENLDARIGSLTIEHQRVDESESAQTTTIGVQLDPPDALGRRAYLGWPAILADPACATGELVRVRATFVTSSGQRLEAEREVRAAPGLNPPPACSSR